MNRELVEMFKNREVKAKDIFTVEQIDVKIARNLITNYHYLGTKKFIPCLREGEFPESFPIILSGCKGHDFSKDGNYDETIDNLCRDIYGKPRRVRPQLGEIPDYAKK